MTSTDPSIADSLSQTERRELLRLARASIGHELGLAPAAHLEVCSPALLANGHAFVTLEIAGRLRGCIGTVGGEEALHEVVTRMATSAAFHDPRFQPLRADEWPEISIEISRLTPFMRVPPDQVVPGRHGLLVERGTSRGLLLPQVAAREGWGREEFLRATCRKAGLAPDLWREPDVSLSVFEAEVFNERQLPAGK